MEARDVLSGWSKRMILFRTFLAVVLGALIGGVVNMGFVVVGPMIIPPPAGVDVTSTEALQASIHLFQPQHFIFPFLAHAVGTLVGCVVAFFVAARYREYLAWLVGVLFLAGGISASFMIPAPAWFIALDLLVAYLPMAWLGIRIGRGLS